jgi:hypothetical protein
LIPPGPTQTRPQFDFITGSAALWQFTTQVPSGYTDSTISKHPDPGIMWIAAMTIVAPPVTQSLKTHAMV